MWSFAGLILLSASIEVRPPDAHLVEALRNNGREAFRSLFDRYHPDLYRFLVRSGVPLTIAEDILQDVFVGVWSGRAHLDPRRSIRAYLYRACRNRAANHFRSRARFVDAPPAEPESKLPLQDEMVDDALLQDRFAAAVSRLPERRRIVFELCYVHGLTYKEAADALDISPKTIENQMGYALKCIRQDLSGYLDDQ